MNCSRPEIDADARLVECWNKSDLCPTQRCHDLLSDQRTVVELDTFGEVWATISEQLKSTVVVDH
jgi:hypothetical protein